MATINKHCCNKPSHFFYSFNHPNSSEVWFDGYRVAKSFDLYNPIHIIEEINPENKMRLSDLVGTVEQIDEPIYWNTIMINKNAVLDLIKLNKKNIQQDVLDKMKQILNLTTREYYSSKIIDAFPNEKCITEFDVYPYRFAIYFPNQKLIIDYDQVDQEFYNEEIEFHRLNYVTEKLNCKIYKFNPNNENFSISTTISNISSLFQLNVEN